LQLAEGPFCHGQDRDDGFFYRNKIAMMVMTDRSVDANLWGQFSSGSESNAHTLWFIFRDSKENPTVIPS
jgi:hypothetical protein